MAVGCGAQGVRQLAGDLIVVGSKLMDLYHGSLSSGQIADEILATLAQCGHVALADFAPWIHAGGGFQVIEIADEQSKWVLRLGDEADRYIHIHPARCSPFTVRVRATVLTTAVLALAHAGLNGGDPLSRMVVNAVRKEHLGLAPVGRDPSVHEGIGRVVELLRGPPGALAGIPVGSGQWQTGLAIGLWLDQ